MAKPTDCEWFELGRVDACNGEPPSQAVTDYLRGYKSGLVLLERAEHPEPGEPEERAGK